MAVMAELELQAKPPPEHDFRIISCNFSGAVPLTPKQLREQRGFETLRVGLVMLLRSYVESRNEEIDLDVVAHALDIAETGTGAEAFDAAIRRLCVKRPAVLAESTVREVAEQLHKLIKARPTSSLPRPSVRRRELLDDKADISKFGYKVLGDRVTIERNGVAYRLTAPKVVKMVNKLIGQLYASPNKPDVDFSSNDAKNFAHGVYRKFYDECVRRVKMCDPTHPSLVLTLPRAHLRLPKER